MGLSGLGKLVALGGAAVGGYMQGKKENDEQEWEKEQREQQRKTWERTNNVDKAIEEAHTFIASRISGDQSPQPEAPNTPALVAPPTDMASVAQQGGNLNQVAAASMAPAGPPQMSPAQGAMPGGIEAKLTKMPLPKDPNVLLSMFATQPGSLRDPETLKGLSQIFLKHKVFDQGMAYLERADKASRENVIPALVLLAQGDKAGAVRAFNASGMKVDENAVAPADDKGNWSVTLPNGSTTQVNPVSMLKSLLNPAEFMKSMQDDRKDARENKKVDAEANNNNATAEYYRGAKTTATLAKGSGGNELQQEKWDEKQIQQHVKEAADVYSLPNVMGEVKPNVEVKGAYTRLARAIGPDRAPQIAAQIRDHAERAAADPKTGELNQELFAKKYMAGWQALNAELMNKTARPAGEMAKPSAEPAKAPSKEPAAKPAPSLKKDPVKTETLKAGSPEAAAEGARVDKIREDRNAKRQAEQDAADEEARAKRKLKVAQAEKEATAVNSLYKR